MPHPVVEYPEAIKADYKMKVGMLVLDMRAPLVGYAFKLRLDEFIEKFSVDLKPVTNDIKDII